MYTDMLQQLGLPRNEARIYEALLRLGPANASQISSASKVNRRNVYDALKNLLNRNLAILIHGQKDKIYQTADPQRLNDILTDQTKQIFQVLPQLQDVYKQHSPTEQASIGRGQEAIKNFWQYVMEQKETTTYFMGGKGAWHDPEIDEIRKEYFSATKKHNVKIKGIFDYEVTEWGQDIYEQYDPELIRYLPKEYSTPATYDICGDRVILFPMPAKRSVENTTVYTLISKSLADSYITWFNFLWQLAKPLSEIKK